MVTDRLTVEVKRYSSEVGIQNRLPSRQATIKPADET